MRGQDAVKFLAEEAGLTANILNKTWIRIHNNDHLCAIHISALDHIIRLPSIHRDSTGIESQYVDLRDPDSLDKIRSFLVDFHLVIEELDKNLEKLE